jgi:hypothetical protein
MNRWKDCSVKLIVDCVGYGLHPFVIWMLGHSVDVVRASIATICRVLVEDCQVDPRMPVCLDYWGTTTCVVSSRPAYTESAEEPV